MDCDHPWVTGDGSFYPHVWYDLIFISVTTLKPQIGTMHYEDHRQVWMQLNMKKKYLWYFSSLLAWRPCQLWFKPMAKGNSNATSNIKFCHSHRSVGFSVCSNFLYLNQPTWYNWNIVDSCVKHLWPWSWSK